MIPTKKWLTPTAVVVGWRQYRAVFWPLMAADSLIVVLFLPQISQALSRTGYYLGTEAWQGVPGLLSPLTTIYYLLFAHRAPIWIAPMGLFLPLAILILTLWEGRRRAKLEHNFEVALWLSLLVPIITVAIISWLAPRSIYVERSFAVASPALVLLLAKGTIAAPRFSPTPYLMMLLIIPVVFTLIIHIITPDPARPPVKEAVQKIEANFVPGDAILHLQDASGIPALWYSNHLHLVANVPGAGFIFDSTHRLFGGDVVPWQNALIGADRLWLIVMPGFIHPEQAAILKEIEATYPQLMMEDRESVRLYLYDLKEAR